MFMRKLVGGVLLLAAASSVSAAVITLDFEGVAEYPHGYPFILDYYNGGTSSIGSSGPNYGISFGSNAQLVCLNSMDVTCSNASHGGLSPDSGQSGLFFMRGNETFLNHAEGFRTGFSFNYVSTKFSGSVGIYDGLNGTGNLLASIHLVPNAIPCPDYNASFCTFGSAGTLFDGVARSVSFGGVANQIVFDDLTFGSDAPGAQAAIPEPATWAMMIAGFGMIGATARRRRRRLAVA